MNLLDLSPSDGGGLDNQDHSLNPAVEPRGLDQIQELVKVNLLPLPEEGRTRELFNNLALDLNFDEAVFPSHLVSRSYAVGPARERCSRIRVRRGLAIAR